MKKGALLITGAGGFLGRALVRAAEKKYGVTALVRETSTSLPYLRALPDVSPNFSIETAELCDHAAMRALFKRIQPRAVIHAAALSRAGDCFADPEASRRVNVEASRNVAVLCAEADIPLAFTSTDMVFDGEHAPYAETDKANPLSVYGRHKAEAEEAVKEACPHALICRLPLLFGNAWPHVRTFFQVMMEKLQQGEALTLFGDEIRTPLDTQAAAEGIMQLLGRESGVFHLGGPQAISRYDFGVLLAEAMHVERPAIRPASLKDMDFAEPRPRDLTLQSEKARRVGFSAPSLREMVLRVVRHEKRSPKAPF